MAADGIRYTSRITFQLADPPSGTTELWCCLFTRNQFSSARLNGKTVRAPKRADGGADQQLNEFLGDQGPGPGGQYAGIHVDDMSPPATRKSGPPRFGLMLAGFWRVPASEQPSPKSSASPADANQGQSTDHVPGQEKGRANE